MQCPACTPILMAIPAPAASPPSAPRTQRWVVVTSTMVSMVAMVSMVRDTIHPYKTKSDERARLWARQFWPGTEPPGKRVDLKTDFGIDFSPSTFQELSWSATYLANQQIYSPRLRQRRAPAWDEVGETRPLLVAEYHDVGKPYDDDANIEWLQGMSSRYRLVDTDDVPMHRYDKSERTLLTADFVRIYTFVPLGDGR